jgi:hypothetical protein
LIGWMRCLKLYKQMLLRILLQMEVEAFFKLLKASEEPLHEHTEVTHLAIITQLMTIKSKYFFSKNCYNDLVNLISDILPKPHKLPKDMYHPRK